MVGSVVHTFTNEIFGAKCFFFGCFITYYLMHFLCMIRKPKSFYIHEFKKVKRSADRPFPKLPTKR